jgi:hypothetical protein
VALRDSDDALGSEEGGDGVRGAGVGRPDGIAREEAWVREGAGDAECGGAREVAREAVALWIVSLAFPFVTRPGRELVTLVGRRGACFLGGIEAV